MDQEICLGRIAEQAAEFEERRHVFGLRRAKTRLRLDDVMEAQVEMAMACETAERWRRRPVGIEQRQQMRDAGGPESVELVDAADGSREPWRWGVVQKSLRAGVSRFRAELVNAAKGAARA